MQVGKDDGVVAAGLNERRDLGYIQVVMKKDIHDRDLLIAHDTKSRH